MFLNRKIKTTVALVSAVASILVNTVTSVAASYGYSSVDDIRAKALGQYLSANTIISMADTKLPIVDKIEDMVSDDVLVAFGEVEETEEVSYNTVKRLNSSLEAGSVVTVREGENGEKNVRYRVKYENGEEVSRETVGEYVTKAPVDKVVEYGSKNASANSPVNTGKLDYKYVLTCNATAYDMSAEENGGYAGQTATGVPLDKGVIAVDPRVIPLGSRVYIEALDGSWSYGYAVAADTGGAIKGNRVDLCYRTRSECIQFGRRPCRVYVLN